MQCMTKQARAEGLLLAGNVPATKWEWSSGSRRALLLGNILIDRTSLTSPR